MLVLLIRGIYEVHRSDGFMQHDILTKFHEDLYGHSSNIKILSQKFERLLCWYYLWEGFIIYAVEMASCRMICLPSFVKIATGVQAILKFYLRNLEGYNVGITYRRDLRSAPMRWAQVA
jgi:hypothetical protein